VEHYDAKISSRMTVCRLRGEGALHRRLDIKVYPRELLPFALLYFTGSDYYNRSLRAFVNKAGWQLSDKGLFKVVNEEVMVGAGGKRTRVVTDRSKSVKCASEEDVLRAIGAPWKAPPERDA
jgi:DNA polymerase lambda